MVSIGQLRDARVVVTAPVMSKLHLVFGGRVSDPRTLDFTDLSAIDVVGMFPDYKSAEKAWRAAAQRTVDDAEMRYVIVHLHRLLDPDDQQG
jgi:hypothetical protein